MIRGILFDKDGTLIDFFSLWLSAAEAVIPQILKENKIQDSDEWVEYLLQSIGVNQGKVDPKGALACKSYGGIAEVICEALEKRGEKICIAKVQRQLEEMFQHNVTRKGIQFQVLAEMDMLMKELKEKDIKIGLATADTLESAECCLTAIGVRGYFDFVGADNGVCKPKPNQEMFLVFAEMFKLGRGEIAVVGDTYNDMVFAKKSGGVAIGVLSGVSKEADLVESADYIITSVKELPRLLEQMEKQEGKVWQKSC